MAKKVVNPKAAITPKASPAGKNLPIVLVVDDRVSALVRSILETKFSGKLHVLEAKNGEQALSMLQEYHDKGTPVAAMSLDSDMPKMDGMSLLRVLEDEYPELRPSVIVPGSGEQEVREAMTEDHDCAKLEIRHGDGGLAGAVARTLAEGLGLSGRRKG